MANNIEYRKAYTAILDEVYQRASVSGCLTSGSRMVRQGAHAKEIMIPCIEVSGLGDYVRNQGYAQGAIQFSYESHSPDYDRGLKLVADVMDVEEAGLIDCFVAAGSELQRTQVAPECDAYTFAKIAGFEGVTTKSEDLSKASAESLLASLREVTSVMDEKQVSTGTRYLFITPTLKGVIDDFSYANPNRSNRVLERFARIVEVPQVRFYTAIDLLSGGDDGFGYRKAEGEYAKTEDTEADASKTYYTKSGDEYTPVIAVSGGCVVYRAVRLDAQRGTWRGLRFTYGKNMAGCVRTVLEQDVYTALYGFGAGLPYTDAEGNYVPGYRRKLTFGDINGGLNYVADEDAKLLWGRWNAERTERVHAFG